MGVNRRLRRAADFWFNNYGSGTRWGAGASAPAWITLFNDNMTGTFSDKWSDVSLGSQAYANYTAGQLRLNGHGQNSGRYGGHAITKGTWTPTGTQKLSCAVWVPPAYMYNDDDLTDGRLILSLVSEVYQSATSLFDYHIVNEWTKYPRHIRTYFRTQATNVITQVNRYSAGLGGSASFPHTYPAGTSLINFYNIIDWDALTVDSYDDTGYLGQTLINGSIKSELTNFRIYIGWGTYENSTYALWDNVKLEQYSSV